ncbi:MAG: FAD-dependent oxidoreductase [Planctomycetota bacterium]
MRAHFLIVGGGIMGLAAAWRCARRGRGPVLLLERRTFGAGSSGRSGAILRTHYKDRELVRIARDSLVEYAGFEGRNGTSIGFHRCGVVTLAGAGQAQWQERVRENVATMRELGVEVELVDAARLRALFPGAVVREGSLASFEPQAGFVDPALALAGFAKSRDRRRLEDTSPNGTQVEDRQCVVGHGRSHTLAS